jgi:hypothetical protein
VRIRVHLVTDRLVTVHVARSWFERHVTLLDDEDYEATRYTAVGGKHQWCRWTNRDVEPDVHDAIEAELTRACVGNRLAALMRIGEEA